MNQKQRVRGFTLIEILVALIVLSLGLLGIASLMIKSVKGNDSAYMRSQTVQLAYSILDMMRANRAQAQSQGYDTAFTPICPPQPSKPSALCDTASCSAAQMATWDTYRWEIAMCSALPSGQGKIVTVTNNGFTTASITIQWDDSRAQNAYTPKGTSGTVSFVLETSL